ncbi:MAG TPA: hypothetical protein VMH34_07575 [Gammaproteobacteria bacterium]|nr:hypothetical protein [Gammaproteobacteria bacterium]
MNKPTPAGGQSVEHIEARLDRKGERIEDANRGLRYGRIPQ